MKKVMMSIAAMVLFFTLSINAFAHSHLAGSNPADGEEVTESLQAITLNFDGKIMQGSYIELTSGNGEKVEVSNIAVGDGVITATFANPLQNSTYKVNWNIISADGHPLEGEYSFVVNAPVEENTDKDVQDNEVDIATPPADTNQNSIVEGSNVMTFTLVGLAVVVIGAAALLLFKRKK